MGLVAYSDSEDSESEANTTAPAARPVLSPGAPSSTGPRKIKVDLPATLPDNEDTQRPNKIRRLGTGFGSFNDFLPAPKQLPKAPGGGAISAATKGLRPGFSLKTSSEAAFSRAPVEAQAPRVADAVVSSAPYTSQPDNLSKPASVVAQAPEATDPTAPKPNPLKFKPLSVTNKKKKKTFGSSLAPSKPTAPNSASEESNDNSSQSTTTPSAKPKTSLFGLSATPNAAQTPDQYPEAKDTEMADYEPLLSEQAYHTDQYPDASQPQQPDITYHQPQQDSNPLSALATEMNLTPSQRRQLMGRHANVSVVSNAAYEGVNIHHFDTTKEYSRNEELRQAGELNQHREVKAVGAGKHSLQQLVNAASSQKEALEDKWAAGKRKQADGGAAYGFR